MRKSCSRRRDRPLERTRSVASHFIFLVAFLRIELTLSPFNLSIQIWMKSAVLERQSGSLDTALLTLEEGIAKFPSFDKLYMIKGQILESQSKNPQARETYAKGVKACPKSTALWILASRLEERAGIVIKARSLLEKARLLNPADPDLWEETVKVEERSGSTAQSRTMLARGESRLAFSFRLFVSRWP